MMPAGYQDDHDVLLEAKGKVLMDMLESYSLADGGASPFSWYCRALLNRAHFNENDNTVVFSVD
jgi:hypothetical protein